MMDAAIAAKNERRIDLIHRKFTGSGLNAEEEIELAQLQGDVMGWASREFPLPVLIEAPADAGDGGA